MHSVERSDGLVDALLQPARQLLVGELARRVGVEPRRGLLDRVVTQFAGHLDHLRREPVELAPPELVGLLEIDALAQERARRHLVQLTPSCISLWRKAKQLIAQETCEFESGLCGGVGQRAQRRLIGDEPRVEVVARRVDPLLALLGRADHLPRRHHARRRTQGLGVVAQRTRHERQFRLPALRPDLVEHAANGVHRRGQRSEQRRGEAGVVEGEVGREPLAHHPRQHRGVVAQRSHRTRHRLVAGGEV